MINSTRTMVIAETDANSQICGLWISRCRDRVRVATEADWMTLSLNDAEVHGASTEDIERWIKTRLDAQTCV